MQNKPGFTSEPRKKLTLVFFIIWIILSAAVFMLLQNNFQTYRSTTSIILIPKNDVSAENASEIAQNLAVLPKYLSFYERLLVDNPQINDPYKNQSAEKRQNLWNENLHVSRIKKSTILKITAFRPTATEANLVSRQTALALFNRAGFYYNIKTDVDLRIIDGPSSEIITRGLYWLILISLALGFIVALLLGYIFRSFGEMARAKRQPKITFDDMISSPRVYSKDKEIEYVNELIYEIPRTKKTPAEEIVLSDEKAKKGADDFPPLNGSRQSQAPVNLPLAEKIVQTPKYIRGEHKIPAPETISERMNGLETKDEKTLREPTDEELKKRLNQLLRGEL